MSTYYESCCDRLPGDCVCGADPAPHCWQCTEAMPYGEEVELKGRMYCGLCAHEEREAMREEETRC